MLRNPSCGARNCLAAWSAAQFRPLRQRLLPLSATGGGRKRCPARSACLGFKPFTLTKNKNGHLTASVSIFGRPSYAKYKYHLLSLGFFCNLDFCKLVMLSFMRKYGKFYNFIERNFCFKKIFTHTKII